MLKSLVFGLVLYTISSGFCQEEPSSSYSNQVKISLDRLGRNTPAIQLSYQHLWNNNSATGITFGQILPESFLLKSSILSNFSGNIIALNQKYFFHNFEFTSLYIAGEIHMIQSHYQARLNFVDTAKLSSSQYDVSGNYYYEDSISISRTVQSLNFLMGIQASAGRLVFEFNLGIGIKYCKVKHSDRLHPNDELYSWLDPQFISSLKQEGKYIRIGIPFNLNLGFMF